VVGSDVTKLVRQGLGSLRRLDIVAHPNHTIVEPRVSIRSTAVATLHHETIRLDETRDAFPQVGRRGSDE
jgi:hypothetical protein